MRRRAALALLAAGAWTSSRADASLEAALAGTHRSAAATARDAWRHPYQTLSFFGIRPDMTVVELDPGGGWYTEILAPYLRANGRLIVAGDDPASASAYRRRNADLLRQKLRSSPTLYDRVELAVLEPPRRLQIALPSSVDMALSFRNVHNWAADGDDVVLAVFRAVHMALKPGGVFGIVEHRLRAGLRQHPRARSGYLHTEYVVRMAQGAGFELLASSEINANPRDSTDHVGGVWALPPNYANQDRDRARYAAIGESDRMTLKFARR